MQEVASGSQGCEEHVQSNTFLEEELWKEYKQVSRNIIVNSQETRISAFGNVFNLTEMGRREFS